MIPYSINSYSTHFEILTTNFSELLCFRNIYSSFSFFFSHLNESAHCDLLLPGLLADSSSCCHIIVLPQISAWLLLGTLRKKQNFSRLQMSIAAIIHSMAFNMSLDIKIDKVTIPTKKSFLKVLYNVCKVKKKNINLNNTPASTSMDPR